MLFLMDQCCFISGNVVSGNGGFNFDGISWYNWYFVVDEWMMIVVNVEYCDGMVLLIGNSLVLVEGDIFYFCFWIFYVMWEVQLLEFFFFLQSGFEVFVFFNLCSGMVIIVVLGFLFVFGFWLLIMFG